MISARDHALGLLHQALADATGGGYGQIQRGRVELAIDYLIEAARAPEPLEERPQIVPSMSFLIRQARKSQVGGRPDWVTAQAHARLICDIVGLPYERNMTSLVNRITSGF